MRTESQELNDQIIVLRLDNNWDSALTKQKIEFLENKISELQTQNKSDCQKYEERLDTLKQDLWSDADRQAQKMQNEFDRMSQKYETKWRAVKDLETEIARLNT